MIRVPRKASVCSSSVCSPSLGAESCAANWRHQPEMPGRMSTRCCSASDSSWARGGARRRVS
eukprot:3937504-Rhodomonas_salina.3